MKKGFKEFAQEHVNEVRLGVSTAVAAGSMLIPTLISYASEPSGGSNLLTGDALAAVTAGFGDLLVTVTQVVSLAAVTGVSVVGLSAAVKYALKKIKGVMDNAA